MKLPADLRPESVTAVIDTREQLQVVGGTLATGDYSVRGLEHVVVLERKSLPDLVACYRVERERFEREVLRLLAYPVRAVVVESQPRDVLAGPLVIAGHDDRQPGGDPPQERPHSSPRRQLAPPAAHLDFGPRLFTAARRRWRECRTLAAGILEQRGAPA